MKAIAACAGSSLLCLAVLAATPAGGAQAPLSDSGAKAVALQAISAMFLKPDAAVLREVVDPSCAVDDQGAGSGWAMVEGFSQAMAEMAEEGDFEDPGEFLSLREILFFDAAGIEALADRFPTKADLWSGDHVRAHIAGGVGCCAIARELQDGEEVDTEVFIFVVKQTGDGPKVVYLDNS
jgi:hypothetical protein